MADRAGERLLDLTPKRRRVDDVSRRSRRRPSSAA